MTTQVPDKIEERLQAHEADLKAIEISSQAATAFIAQSKGATTSHMPPPPPSYNNVQGQLLCQRYRSNRSYCHCNNCGREGHSASRCYAMGGGLAGRTPWKGNQGQFNNSLNWIKASNVIPQNLQKPQKPIVNNPNIAYLAGNDSTSIIMMANIKEIDEKTILSNRSSSISKVEDNTHIWLVDSAASSHLSGNINLFNSIYFIPPVSIHTANGDSFTANQKGTIRLTLRTLRGTRPSPNITMNGGIPQTMKGKVRLPRHYGFAYPVKQVI